MRRLDGAGRQADELREMMERQVGHLVRLVDDLLDVSRILRGKIELRFETLDLATVLARAVETTLPLIESQGHELSLSLGPEATYVEGDPVRLAQVFANLLNNAAKYTERGGQIGVAVESNSGEVTIRVQDNGIGISPEMLPRVFDVFSQAERSLDRSQGGLGLGLTLVQRLTEMHGGAVEAHSEGLGRGSEFRVRLPQAHVPGGAARAMPDSRAAIPLRRILVVDDNADAVNSLAQLLRLEGHEVRTAYDGPGAVETAKAFRPHVAILDIGLPGLNGHEVARQLRQAGLEELVLIAVTGYGQAQDRRHTLEAGFDHHLVKPINPDELPWLFIRGASSGV
jgi:CheY-like chemotaxis protein